MRNLATILPLKSKLSGKFQHFNTKYEVSKCWKIVEFLKFSFKIKKCKTFYEAQTAGRLKEIIQLPSTYLPPDKTLLFFWNKNFLTEIYRHLVSKCFKNVVLGRQEMVKPNRKMFSGKLVKSETVFLDALREHIVRELRFVKRVRFFERNCIIK